MSFSMPYRLRQQERNGFSGFEGRHYSVFSGFSEDLGSAMELQTLVTALAYNYVLRGKVVHEHIPDHPFAESERRQIFFAVAIGLPTFYVRSDTGNRFLLEILERVQGVRHSRRYPGYFRVYTRQYCLALANMLKNDAGDLVDLLGVRRTVDDLSLRLENPEQLSAEGKLLSGILDLAGARSPMDLSAEEFARSAEQYYRTSLRDRHLQEGLDVLTDDLRAMETRRREGDQELRELLAYTVGSVDPCLFLISFRRAVVTASIATVPLVRLILMLLISIRNDAELARPSSDTGVIGDEHTTSICGSRIQQSGY
jgi:hypothetical protein